MLGTQIRRIHLTLEVCSITIALTSPHSLPWESSYREIVKPNYAYVTLPKALKMLEPADCSRAKV
jgi:hypothetical protein